MSVDAHPAAATIATDPPPASVAVPSRHRPRPRPAAQADRLRQAARRHGPAARRRSGLRPVRQTLRHRRSRRHPRPHHRWPASRRGPGSHAQPARRKRPGPHALARPPARPTPARPHGRLRRRTLQPPNPARRATPRIPRLARLPTERKLPPGAPSPGRRRDRRYLPRPRHRAGPARRGVLGRTQPRHHHLWRQPRRLPRHPDRRLFAVRPRRSSGPGTASATAASAAPATGPP